MDKQKRLRGVVVISNILASMVIIFLIILSLLYTNYLDKELTGVVESYGPPALFLTSFFLDFIPQIISPILVLGAGIFAGINIHLAIISTIAGSTIGSLIAFFLGKKYMFRAVDILASKKKVNRMTLLVNKYGKIIVPLTAISPLPYLPVVLGAINMSKRNFIIYGLVARALSLTIWGYGIYLF
tara:strand:+ start:433 stop:984 length:552 start_codon:yes stop_codon:yes gene_type:complete